MRYIIFLLIILASCSPERKLLKLRAKHPEMFTSDTVKVIDTIFIVKETKDTTFVYNSSKDTVFMKEGRLTVKYFYKDSTVYLGGECRDSVIIREISVPVERGIIEKKMPWWGWLIIAGCVFVFAVLLRKL